MQQSIQNGAGYHVVLEDGAPFAIALVGSQNHRSSLVTLADQLEQTSSRLPGNQEIWSGIQIAVVNLGPTVNTLGGTYQAYLLGTGEGEDVPTGTVCASTTATIPDPASTIPSAPPPALSAFLNAVQGAVVPSVIVAYPGMAALGLVSSVLGQPPTTATWSIQPADGSAGTVTNQAGSLANAIYNAPATVAAPSAASVAVTLNGSVTVYVPIVLLPLQPTVTVTPTATQVTPPTSASFTASVANCNWTLVPAGIGSIDGNGNYSPPASVGSPTSVLVVASTSSPAQIGFACVQVTPSS